VEPPCSSRLADSHSHWRARNRKGTGRERGDHERASHLPGEGPLRRYWVGFVGRNEYAQGRDGESGYLSRFFHKSVRVAG
jgi:hypothetical protein